MAPKFVRRYAELGEAAREALTAFAADVREGRFPNEDESFHDPARREAIRKIYG
jgi:3-methyl-2-oxobutanoate hydroxymethyltransferase